MFRDITMPVITVISMQFHVSPQLTVNRPIINHGTEILDGTRTALKLEQIFNTGI